MKKLNLMMGLAAICMLLSFSSCKKEVECCNNGNCVTLKQDDFGSKALYDASVNSYKLNGYTCK